VELDLVASTEAAGIRTVRSGILPKDTAGLALHRKAGVRVVGTRQRVGPPALRRDVVLVEHRGPTIDS